MKHTTLFATATFFAALAAPLAAQTELETALDAGGERLSSDQIAALIVDKTVTARAGQKSFVFYYDTENGLSGRMIDGDWADSGYYGITDDDRVCLSMSPDEGRLRCLTLVRSDGNVSKYTTAGEKSFELLNIEPGDQR